jgi:hypothetical protein
MLLTSLTATPTPVHAESPSTSLQIPALQVSPTSANAFAAVSDYGLDDQAIEVQSLAEAKGFFL